MIPGLHVEALPLIHRDGTPAGIYAVTSPTHEAMVDANTGALLEVDIRTCPECGGNCAAYLDMIRDRVAP